MAEPKIDLELKAALTKTIRSMMNSEYANEFKAIKSSLLGLYIQNHTAAECALFNATLNSITYQSIVSKKADKDSEKLLVLNADGTSTGKFEDRKVVHNKSKLLWHREVAGIQLRQDGTLLIIIRSSHKKSYPGAKGLVCGHVEGNQTYHEAVVHEVGEEVGTLYNQKDFIRLTNPEPNERDDNKAFTCAYVTASKLKEGIMLYQDNEVDGFQWITLNQLKRYVDMSTNQDPEIRAEVIFKNTKFYQELIKSLEKLFTLNNWYDHLASCDYKTIHKHLKLKTPTEDFLIYKKGDVE